MRVEAVTSADRTGAETKGAKTLARLPRWSLLYNSAWGDVRSQAVDGCMSRALDVRRRVPLPGGLFLEDRVFAAQRNRKR